MHIPRPNPALFPQIRELVYELPPGATLFDCEAELETLGSSIFDEHIPAEIAEIMREKIMEFTRMIREFKMQEKEKERAAARAEIARIFESLTGRDEQARTALLIALDPLCMRLSGAIISLRGELAPQFGSLRASEVTESLLRFGSREKIVQIAQGLKRDLLKIKSLGVSISLKRIDLFISKFNQAPPASGGRKAEEKEETQHGFSASENEQYLQ